MEYIPFYLVHGLATKTRKRRLYDRIRKSASSDAKKGLPTRIPFLKRTMCGQDVPNGEPSGLSSTRCPWSEAKVGDMFHIPTDWKIYFKLKKFVERIRLFNAHKAKEGVQAFPLPVSKSAGTRFSVCECDVRYVGDIKIARVLDPDIILYGEGQYRMSLFQIFMKGEQECLSWRSLMIHELEHATHRSIWHFLGFPNILLSHEDTEYLSMLRTMHRVGDTHELLVCDSQYIQFQFPDDYKETPHDAAGKRFFAILQSRYGLTEYEIAMGMAYSMRDKADQPVDQSFAEHLEKIQRAAEAEYRRTYEAIFGLSLDDIKEIIDNLPVI